MKKAAGLIVLILTLFLISSNTTSQGGDPDNGADLYAQKCARCHGSTGEGEIGPSLKDCSICDSLEPLYDKIKAEMPYDNPQDCIDTCTSDTAAFIFVNLNGNSLDSSTYSGSEDEWSGCFISVSIE